jgi:hypothetical protein
MEGKRIMADESTAQPGQPTPGQGSTWVKQPSVPTLVGIHASGEMQLNVTHHDIRHHTSRHVTYQYKEGWHFVADFHTRIKEVRQKGDDHDARMTLQRHCFFITIGVLLTFITTFMASRFLHWDFVIPIPPNYVQELHDWVYKL